ncbi:MAG: allophanate hydrolase subunit 1 [Pseudomonadota bacterium]
MTARFLPSGDTGLVVQLSDVADHAINARVRQLFEAVNASGLSGVIEAVPTYRSLLVQYDPLVTTQADLVQAIEPLISAESTERREQVRRWELPICCEGDDFAPDLDFMAHHASLTPKDIVEVLAETEQTVYMLGFAPGQPYLGDLPEAMIIPRRANPIPKAPKGSVVTATGKTVIYPVDNPTGWYLLGRTPVEIFRAGAAEPALFAPGDRLVFKPVSRSEFDQLEQRARQGDYQPDPEIIA